MTKQKALPDRIYTIGRNIVRNIMRKPYLDRGRRTLNGRCIVCGKYYLKYLEYVEKKDKNNKTYIAETLIKVNCPIHGSTKIDNKAGEWILTINGIQYIGVE